MRLRSIFQGVAILSPPGEEPAGRTLPGLQPRPSSPRGAPRDGKFAKSRSILSLIFAAVMLAGCHTRTLPDPNDPNDVGHLQPEVLRRNLKWASDSLLERKQEGQITDAQFHTYMTQAANELLSKVDIQQVPPSKAWEYAEVFRTAKRWKEAEKLYQVAVKAAKNEDRLVNDSLHLAQCMCENGEVAQALPIAKSTFKVSDWGKAPILWAVLLEIVPAAEGKGHDQDLAELLEGSIAQAEATKVDPNTPQGASFLTARPYKVRDAWIKVLDLYTAAGRQDLAAEARNRALADLPVHGR